MYAILRRSTALFLLTGSLLATTNHVSAQAQSMALELEPHCEERSAEIFGDSDPSGSIFSCASYEVISPESRATEVLKPGDLLDMDLVVRNPERLPVERIHAWLTFDPSLFEGVALTIAKRFPSHTPGETDFAPFEGYVKIDVSPTTPITDENIVVAHLAFRVLSATTPRTIIGTYDSTGQPSSHTAIFSGGNNLLTTPSPVLQVNIGGAESPTMGDSSSLNATHQSAGDAIVTPGSSSSLQFTSSASRDAVTPEQASMFTLLQVRNLRITTEDHSVFLAWDLLPSTELKGYNMYYGTISGQYLQRRNVDRTSNTLTLRALPEDVQYFFAVRGVNAQGQETEFSQEVAVTVGQPRTSTSPLVGYVRQKQAPPPPKTGGTVAGNTGIPSSLLLLLLGSAVIGTGLAFRRQCIATVLPSHE